MAKMRKKADLPRKLCATCGLPFTWRKKWARDWDQVRHCSDRCRAGRSAGATPAERRLPAGPARGVDQRRHLP